MGGAANPAVLGLLASGTIGQAVGAHREGKAIERAARFNAEITRRETDQRIEQSFSRGRRRRAENITRVAKSGVRLSGSPLAVLEENEYQESREREFVRQAGALSVNLLEMRGRAARDAARFGVASSVIGGAGRIGTLSLIGGPDRLSALALTSGE